MSDKKNKKLYLRKHRKKIEIDDESEDDVKSKSRRVAESSSDDSSSEEITKTKISHGEKSHNKRLQTINRIIHSDSDKSGTDKSDTNSEEVFMKAKGKLSDDTDKPVKNSNEIFKELIKRQLPDVPAQWKLNINDMKRICKYINTSIFDTETCCIWNGYITNINNSNKGTYVNFYFRNKKVALHRLLYSNFVAPLDSSEYLKFNCENKGICCNINHYEKYKYSKNNAVFKKEIKHKISLNKSISYNIASTTANSFS